jgi:hypothetical protein
MNTVTPTASLVLANENTARAALRKVRDQLIEAAQNHLDRSDYVAELVVKIRPAGLLTVDEMAQALDRRRGYVDNLWATSDEMRELTAEGKQTRVPVKNPDPERARHAYESLADAGASLKRATQQLLDARAERNRVVAMIYGSKVLGPSAIAAESGIDRNHVLRLSRRAGVPPQHRDDARNQYSAAS